jgi:hypothetical protein
VSHIKRSRATRAATAAAADRLARDPVAPLLKTLGVAQRDAMQILGHARISVTLEIYTDSDSDSQRDAFTGMSHRLFGQPEA